VFSEESYQKVILEMRHLEVGDRVFGARTIADEVGLSRSVVRDIYTVLGLFKIIHLAHGKNPKMLINGGSIPASIEGLSQLIGAVKLKT
jgi:DNA-binding FadR family transcriptional regulator